MKRLAIIAFGAALLFGTLIGVAYLLIESGEVIVLHTTDGQGSTFQTRLWVVDHQGRPWVGTTDPSHTTWVARIRAVRIAVSQDHWRNQARCGGAGSHLA